MSAPAPRLAAVALLGALVVAACGGDGGGARRTPEAAVRTSTAAYLRALQDRRWARACGLMTAAARRDVEDAAGASCGRALASGAVLAPDALATAAREVAGADVRVTGAAATIGPLGGLAQPLRLERVAGRWLVAG